MVDRQELTSDNELLTASGGDSFVRYDVAEGMVGPAYALGGAVGFVRRSPRLAGVSTPLVLAQSRPVLAQYLPNVGGSRASERENCANAG